MNNQESTDIYERVTDLFIKEKRNVSEVKNILLNEGISGEKAQMIIDEVSNRIKTLKQERAGNAITLGVGFFILGIVFCVMRENEAVRYGDGMGYIGIIVIAFGIYKIVRGFINKLRLKRNDFSRILD
jgi:hypothetical protein